MSGWDDTPAAASGGDDWNPVSIDTKEEGFQPALITVPGESREEFFADDDKGAGGEGGEFSGECRNCGKTGHRGAECPDQVCRNCKAKGHHSRDCPEPVTCRVCKSTEHTSSSCPDMICKNCGDKGHGSRNCPKGCGICGNEEHKNFDCPDQKCNYCEETGHVAKDCPKKAEIPCRNCLQPGHAPGQCTAPRKEDLTDIPEATMEEAWSMLKKASEESDLDSFKDAFRVYTKACPEAKFEDLQESFVDEKFKYILVAITKELELSQTIVDLQGNMDKKYVVTFQTGLQGRRKRLATNDRYPATPEENMERLKQAGFVKECFVPWCSNCHERGHQSRACNMDLIPKETAIPEIKCVNCDEIGHRARDCTKERKVRLDPNACRNCGALDHISKDCTEPRDMSNVQCRKCEQFGHAAKECPEQECFNCGEKGHSKFDCTNPPKGVTCNNCGEEGHMRRDCPKPMVMKCRNCDEEGHSAKECPKPRDMSRVKCNECNEMGHFASKCPNPRPAVEDDGGNDNDYNVPDTGVSTSAGDWNNNAAPAVAAGGWD